MLLILNFFGFEARNPAGITTSAPLLLVLR